MLPMASTRSYRPQKEGVWVSVSRSAPLYTSSARSQAPTRAAAATTESISAGVRM